MDEVAQEEDPENVLLHAARNGDIDSVKRLLDGKQQGQVQLDVNCKVCFCCSGKNKANLGWTPLHLASYFGHKEVVLHLLENGADVNVINDVGDTALHRAAYTGRVEVVMLLLKFNADVTVINAEGSTPKNLARNSEIKTLLEAAESVTQRRVEEDFMKAAREGDMTFINQMLKTSSEISINCTDKFGNTALHTAAYRGQTEVAVLLMQNGIDATLKNAKGQTAMDMARDAHMKQLLEMQPIKVLQKTVQRFEGRLLKRSKLMGWRPYYAVLERGIMSFFRNRADASTGHQRKSFRYLDDARVVPKQDVANVFTIKFSDAASLTLAVDADTSSQFNRQKWENSIAEHIAYSRHYTRVADDESNDEDVAPLGSMAESLQTAQTHQQLLENQVKEAVSAINSVVDDKITSAKQQVNLLQLRVQLAQITETSQDMLGALSHCLNLFTQQDGVRKAQVSAEMEKSRVLQEALHALAQEHHQLEQNVGAGGTAQHGGGTAYSDEEDDEFYDCDTQDVMENGGSGSLAVRSPDIGSLSSRCSSTQSFQVHLPDAVPPSSLVTLTSSDTSHPRNHTDSTKEQSLWNARLRLPVPMFSRNDFSVWSILKQCIGKELSKITMPVIFNEPLSFLQRIVEYMEYATLLNKAAMCDDPVQRLEYVTAFAMSMATSNWERVGKPFNPLLGETYELDRSDLGFRIVAEQVSHHPPVSAFHADSPAFRFHGAIHPKLKFWGKSVEAIPKGTVCLQLLKHNEVYTWTNVNCCVHNIIVGKLWIELYGVMEITNHKTKHKSVLNFKPSGWFGKDLHKLEGFIYDKDKKKLRALCGKWVDALYSYDMSVWENYQEAVKNKTYTQSSEASTDRNDDDVPSRGSACDLNLPNQKLLWCAIPRPSDSSEYYNFTLFAMMLNELRDSQKSILPPTDARLRPDIRKLELGDIDGAAVEKNRLEEKQRTARKDRKKSKGEWAPRWFRMDTNPHTGKEDWLFTNEYWNRKWDRCPDIF